MRFDTGLQDRGTDGSGGRDGSARALARDAGATRFCMGAAYRSPKAKDLHPGGGHDPRGQSARAGDLRHPGDARADEQAQELKAAGLDFYNHNLDTSAGVLRKNHQHTHLPGSTGYARSGTQCGSSSLAVGGNVGMGEAAADRIAMLHTLATLPTHPESVPMNRTGTGG